MTQANDLDDVRSAAVLEQITRWALTDNWGGGASAETQNVVWAAETAGHDHFVGTLVALAEQEGHGSRASMLHATLQGNADLLGHALGDNEGLRSLYRTTAERAQGIDMAEVTTPNGLRLRAEQTGEAYEATVLVEDKPGRSDVLASGTITAATASDALRAAAEREHAVHGLDRTDIQLVDQQLARLDYLAAIEAALPGAAPVQPRADSHAQWADTVTEVTGRDLRAEPGWTTLGETLDRAAAAGWDVASQLPVAVAQAPCPRTDQSATTWPTGSWTAAPTRSLPRRASRRSTAPRLPQPAGSGKRPSGRWRRARAETPSSSTAGAVVVGAAARPSIRGSATDSHSSRGS